MHRHPVRKEDHPEVLSPGLGKFGPTPDASVFLFFLIFRMLHHFSDPLFRDGCPIGALSDHPKVVGGWKRFSSFERSMAAHDTPSVRPPATRNNPLLHLGYNFENSKRMRSFFASQKGRWGCLRGQNLNVNDFPISHLRSPIFEISLIFIFILIQRPDSYLLIASYQLLRSRFPAKLLLHPLPAPGSHLFPLLV